MSGDPALDKGTGWLRGPSSNLERRQRDDGGREYVLDGRVLQNGDEVEVALRGNDGWESVTIAGLPEELDVVFEADDGTQIQTSLSPGIPMRWP